MPSLMGELLASWHVLEDRMERLPPDDPRLAPLKELEQRMQQTYQRLCDVYPRTRDDMDLVLLLIAQAHGLLAAAATRGQRHCHRHPVARAGRSAPDAPTPLEDRRDEWDTRAVTDPL